MNETVVGLLADATGIGATEIVPTLTRTEDDRWDSLSHLRLITALEESFSVKFTMDEIENIQTVADIEALLAQRTA
ncbi:MAG: acyl carrier protein [Pseudomonadota bacterium]